VGIHDEVRIREFQKVSEEEFDLFLKRYPKIVSDVNAAFEPPLITYNDFSSGEKWPESVVARRILNDPDEYYIAKLG
jgi:hypothetical protein